MPPFAVPSRLALVLLLGLPLVGCGDDQPPRPSADRPVLVEPRNPSVASGVADPTAPRIVSVVVDGASTTGDTGVVELRRNVPVRLVVISDRSDTVLVEGYDLRALAVAEVPVQLDFIADRAGEFRVTLEDSGLVLTRLRVG